MPELFVRPVADGHIPRPVLRHKVACAIQVGRVLTKLGHIFDGTDFAVTSDGLGVKSGEGKSIVVGLHIAGLQRAEVCVTMRLGIVMYPAESGLWAHGA